jgi:acyl carrier protein
MGSPISELSGPLARLTEAEVEHFLRGFPEAAVKSALALRESCDAVDLQGCLFGILVFYLPLGTESTGPEPSGDTRLREDLGLDSLSVAESMFKLEELFDIRVETTEIAEIVTIADARCLLMEKLAARSESPADE